jgi:hypothetical protein
MIPYIILFVGLVLDVLIVLAIARVIGFGSDRSLRDWEGEE